MSLNLTTLFTRIGAIQGCINAFNTFAGTTAVTDLTNMASEYSGLDNAFIDGWATTTLPLVQATDYPTALQTYAQNTVIGMANEAAVLPDSTLGTALSYVYSQMVSQAATIQSSTVGSSTSASSSNNGAGVWIISTKSQGGLTLENTYAETLTATCTADSQTGGTLVGSEILTVQDGQPPTSSLSYLWPAGSGTNTTVTACNPSVSEQPGNNILYNSSFETWTLSTNPDGWEVSTGTVAQSSTAYYGSSSLLIVGDGSTHTTFGQEFNSSTGTTIALNPLVLTSQSNVSQYLVNLWCKVSSTPAAGVLQVALVSSPGGSVINDYQGNANSYNVALTGVSTSWLNFGGAFRLPTALPSTIYLQLKLTTALSNAVSLYIDGVTMCQGTQLYTQGPYVAFVSKPNPPLVVSGDSWGLSFTNTFGGATPTTNFQSVFAELFDTPDLGILLPSSNSPSLSNSLIST